MCPVYLNAGRYPGRVALSWGGRSIFWGAVNSYVHSTARYLKEIAVRPEARILLLAERSPAYFIVLMALWRIGALTCPVKAQGAEDPENIFSIVKPEMVISSRQERGVWARDARWADVEQAVAYGYNDLFLGSEGSLGGQIDRDRPLILRVSPDVTRLSYAGLKADPGDLGEWVHALETGDALMI
ncbi:MAG: AMP-binding protein [Candidatus Omnitrophota bacterium]